MKSRLLLVLVASLFIAGDKSRHHRAEKGPTSNFEPAAIKIPMPEVQQPDDYSCGAAALMALCAYYGAGPEELDDFKRHLGTTARGGTYYDDIVKYAKKLKFDVTLVKRDMTDAQLKEALNAKKPVICSILAYADDPAEYEVAPADRLKPKHNRHGHYVVAIGYDDENVYFMDPSLTGRRGFLSWKDLDKRWHENERTVTDPEVYARLGIIIGPKECTAPLALDQ